MTPRETLKKYGLKTDVKSIRERMDANEYWKLAFNECWRTKEITVDDIAIELAAADITLLCELAEKGERAIELIKCNRRELNASLEESTSESSKSTYEFGLDLFDDLIDELEGDPK